MNPHRDQLLDLYLDGMLEAPQREAFERELSQDSSLSAVVERQTRLDASLRRAFDVPSFDVKRLLIGHDPSSNGNGKAYRLPQSVKAGADRLAIARQPAQTSRRTGWLKYGAIAAAVLISFAVFAWIKWGGSREPEYPEMAWRSVEMVYRIETQKGFKPLWKCETDEEFAKTYWENLGQAMVVPMPQLPKDTEMAGLSYSNTFSPKTVLFFGRMRGTPVIVFADRVEKDVGAAVSAESGLRLYRKPIGDLVLYEVSPLDRPYFLEHFQQIPMPEAWKK